MGITDDQSHPIQATLHQAVQEVSPVQLLLTQRNGHTQDQALAFQVHSTGNQHGCIPDLPIDSHFFVPGVQV